MVSKNIYTSPSIQHVTLDSEFSLSLESTPPLGPDELYVEQSTPDLLRTELLL